MRMHHDKHHGPAASLAAVPLGRVDATVRRVVDSSGRSASARLVLSLGPATVAAGLVWGLLQPYRITLLDPQGESFWWLAVQPPLLVVLAGVVFHFAVARGLVRDLFEAERRRGTDR